MRHFNNEKLNTNSLGPQHTKFNSSQDQKTTKRKSMKNYKKKLPLSTFWDKRVPVIKLQRLPDPIQAKFSSNLLNFKLNNLSKRQKIIEDDFQK